SLYYTLHDQSSIRFKVLDGKFANYEGQQGQVAEGSILVPHKEFERLRDFRALDESGRLLLLDQDIQVSDLRIGVHPIEFNYLKENNKDRIEIERARTGVVRL